MIASTGIEAYALFSQQCVDAMDVDVSALGMRASSETYEHMGAYPCGSTTRPTLAGGGVAHARHRRRARSGLPVRHADFGPAAGRLGVRDNWADGSPGSLG